MTNVPRNPSYATNNAINKVYVYNRATDSMEFHSAHTTFLLAQSEIINILKAGYIPECTLYHKYGMYTYTCDAITCDKPHKSIYRDGARIA